MPSRAPRNLAITLLLTTAGVALGVLWAARQSDQKRATVRVLPPSRGNWQGNEPELTAVPHDASSRLGGADDYEAIGPEDLSSAFLSRATESWSGLEGGGVDGELNDELQGFHIATIEELTAPDVRDDPADFEIPSGRRA